MPEFAAMKIVGVLHIAAPAAFGNDAGVIGTFDRDAAITGQTMMNIHAPLRIMDIAAAAIRAGPHRGAICRMEVMTARRGRTVDKR